jgi:hypothetical protein
VTDHRERAPRAAKWRVDFKVKADMVLAKDQKEAIFKAPDGSHAIHLLTKRGEGKHAADELYLSAHVILDGEDPREAGDEAEALLRRFLDVLAVVTGGSYRIEHKVLVVDWTPGLTERRFLHFRHFPDPNVPLLALNQQLVDSVAKLVEHEIPRAVRLAIRWWARGTGDNPLDIERDLGVEWGRSRTCWRRQPGRRFSTRSSTSPLDVRRIA